MPTSRWNAKVVGILILGCGLACGGGSGGSRTGSGGANAGTGGASAATGGRAGGGGIAGTSGGGGAATGGAAGSTAVGFACAAAVAPNATVTDFSDGTSAGRWGTAPTALTGGISAYRNTGGTIMSGIDTTAHNLHMVGAVMGYAGVVVYFDLCTNAARFTGVQFTLAGDLGTCVLELQVQTNSDKLVEPNGMKGTCASGCTNPRKVVTVTGAGPQPIVVHWTDITGGTPVPFGATSNQELVALQWQLTSATSCTADITIDDVVWTTN
jgi:hypothetical protein